MPERSVRRIGPTQSLISSNCNVGFKRPSRLYRKPEAIQALAVLPDHPPRAFTWRGQRYHVARADGPERIKGECWLSEDEDGQVRDYYILEADNGERFWVFCTGDGVNSDTGALSPRRLRARLRLSNCDVGDGRDGVAAIMEMDGRSVTARRLG